jgi:hypothetical protein
MGLNCEIDVRCVEGKLYLGHDRPTFPITEKFLEDRQDRLWIHCKDNFALNFFVSLLEDFHFFWHQEDDYTITSKGYIWVFPGHQVLKRSIWVLPEQNLDFEGIRKDANETELSGICTDYPKTVWDLKNSN